MSKILPTIKEKAIELRKNGKTISSISKELNICHASVKRITEGIQLSDTQKSVINNSKTGKYEYNLSLFDNPTAISYYLLGAFLTDGSVDLTSRRISIVSKDKDWLISIKDIVSPNNVVSVKPKSNCYCFRINNEFIMRWFIANNCVPNKSLIVKFPLIPEKFLGHFLRGLWDGDGSLYTTKSKSSKRARTQLRANIVSGSKDFSDSLSQILTNMGIKNYITIKQNLNKSIFGRPPKDYNTTYTVNICNSDIINFCNLIYGNKKIFLERKFLIFTTFLETYKEESEVSIIPFENKETILKLLETMTYKEVGFLYNISRDTVRRRLKALM